jgi:hypothetical protein
MILIYSIFTIIVFYFLFLYMIVFSFHRIGINQKEKELKATQLYSLRLSLKEYKKKLKTVRLKINLYDGNKNCKVFKDLIREKKEYIYYMGQIRQDIMLLEYNMK